MEQLILGLGNKARQGKDTAAEAIAKWAYDAGIPCMRLAFADALRREVTEAIYRAGSPEQLLNDGPEPGVVIPAWVTLEADPVREELLPHGKHPKLLQWWGTEYRRGDNPNYWVDIWKQVVSHSEGIIIAPDTRFMNEAWAITEMGGYTINVRRLNIDGTQYFANDRAFDHPSEINLDGLDWDFRIIAKSGQIELVRRQACTIVEYLIDTQELF